MKESVSIRQIQHYLYCPHRWGLLHIDCSWAENYFVVKANLLHEHVHSDSKYTSRGKKVYTNLDVWNDNLGIYGKTDCIEFAGDNITVVEYKPSAPAGHLFNEDDAIQVYAQKLCVDEVFSCNSEAVIYYADSKKRILLPFDSEGEYYNKLLTNILYEIRIFSERGIIPPVKKNQNCSGCSMKDMCIPSVAKKKQTVLKDLILKNTEVEL